MVVNIGQIKIYGWPHLFPFLSILIVPNQNRGRPVLEGTRFPNQAFGASFIVCLRASYGSAFSTPAADASGTDGYHRDGSDSS